MLKRKIQNVVERLNVNMRQLFLMYICIFCLPLIFSLLLTNNSINALEEQVQKTAQSMNRQVQVVVDSRMHDIEVLIDQINNHATIRYLLNQSSPLSNADRYRCVEIINDLRKQYVNTIMVEDLFIYMKQSDSVLSTFSRSDSRFFYENYYSYEGISYEEWLEQNWADFQEMTVLSSRPVFNGVSTKNLITVLQSLPRESGVYQTGLLTVYIDEAFLLSQIAPESTYDRSVWIFSQSGEQILKSDSGVDARIDLSSFTGKEGSYSLDMDGCAMHVSWIHSDVMDWTYVLILPTEQFFSQVNRLRTSTMCVLGIVGVIGVALAALVAYMSIIPATPALQMMSQDRKGASMLIPYSISIREVGAYIQEAMDNRNLYVDHIPLLIETYVYKLINGMKDAESELAMVSDILGFRFPTNQFVVMSFHFRSTDDSRDRLRDVLSSIKCVPDVGMDMYGTVLSGDIAAVLVSLWATSVENYREILHRAAGLLIQGMYEQSGERPDISVSLIGNKYEEINKLFCQSQLCLVRTDAQTEGRIIFYDDIARVVPPSDYSYSLIKEKNLISYVCAGDSQRMSRLLDEIFIAHENESSMIAGMTQCLKYDMIGTLFRCAQKVNQDSGVEGETWQTIQAIMALDRPNLIYEEMRKAFGSLCDRAHKSRSTHSDSMRDKMLQYVADNYQNPEMGLDMAARAFGFTPSYMSRFFKEQTGGNFIDHVNQLRVEHAANLLRTTELSYSAVAEQCGLSGSQALNRLFNRVLGVSPTVYRQLALQGSLNLNE